MIKKLILLLFVILFTTIITFKTKSIFLAENPLLLDEIDECVDISKAFETNAIYREYERESDVYKQFRKITTLSKNSNIDNTYIIYKIEDLSMIEVITYYYEMTRTDFNRFKFFGSKDNITYNEINEVLFDEVASKPFVEVDVYFKCTYTLDNLQDYYYFKIEWPKLAGNWWNNSLVSVNPTKANVIKNDCEIEVLDINNNPINNALVSVGHVSVLTSSTGLCQIPLKKGAHDLKILVPGYQVDTHQIDNDLLTTHFTIKLNPYLNSETINLENFYSFYQGAEHSPLLSNETSVVEGNIEFVNNTIIITPNENTTHLLFGKQLGYINFNEIKQLTFDCEGFGEFTLKIKSMDSTKEINYVIDSNIKETKIIDINSLNFFGIKDVSFEIIVKSINESVLTFSNFNFYGNFETFGKYFETKLIFYDEITDTPIVKASIIVDGVSYTTNTNGEITTSLSNGIHYYTFNYQDKHAYSTLQINSDYNNKDVITRVIYFQLIQKSKEIKPIEPIVILLTVVLSATYVWGIIWYYLKTKKVDEK
jgi:hypothetical protein